jgi:hypothetical protein
MKTSRWISMVLALAMLGASAGPAAAQSTGADKRAVDKASPNLMKDCKVTKVDAVAKTFTVVQSNSGKEVTFSGAKLKALPTVGEILDISYTRTPDGVFSSSNLNRSKSNIN